MSATTKSETRQEAMERIFSEACKNMTDIWLPGSGGTETAFTSRSGVRMLYCYNPGQNRHAYLNIDTDIIMTQDEASNAINGDV